MSKWISVEDEMPEESGFYIISHHGQVREACWSPKEYHYEKDHWLISNHSGEYELEPHEPTHWQPLPEPPL